MIRSLLLVWFEKLSARRAVLWKKRELWARRKQEGN